MINFFLYNNAIDLDDIDEFIYGMSELNLIFEEKLSEEIFYKHNNVWAIRPIIQLYKEPRQDSNFLHKFIGSLNECNIDYTSSNDVDNAFPNDKNGFLGITFSENDSINENCRITNKTQANLFRSGDLKEISVNDFWKNKEQLFSNLIFCENVKEQIENFGDSKKFAIVKQTLIDVNKYLINQSKCKLSMGKLIHELPFKISPESDQTLSQYSKERCFKIPSGDKLIFNYHIKKGEMRIYLEPVKDTNKLYIGYVGKHLSTVIYN